MANMHKIMKLIHYMKELSAFIGLAVVFAVSGHVLVMVIPALLMQMGVAAYEGITPSWTMFVVLIVLSLGRGVLRYGEHYFGHYVAFRVLAKFRNAVFRQLRLLAPNKLTAKNSGTLLKMIGEDIEALEVFFAHTLAPVLTGIVLTVLLAVYTWTVHPLMTLVALVTYALLAVIFPKIFAMQLQPHLATQGEARTAYTHLFVDSLKGMKDLVQFQKAGHAFCELQEKSEIVNDKEKEVSQLSYAQMAMSFLIVGVSIIAVSVLLLDLYQGQQLTLSQATTALVVYTSSFAAYLELNRLPLGFKRAILAGDRVFALLDETPVANAGTQTVDTIDTIVVEDMSFHYPERSAAVFENWSGTFEKGKIIGLFGPSGRGKTTLMKLVMNWMTPISGKVTLNGVETTDIDREAVQEHFAYIPQIPQLFKKTLRDNLRMANMDLTDEEILAAAEKCNCKDVILSSEQGLDTIFNPTQPQFSAGEMQRLELTRAILKKADVYVFDEPTSHLDSLNEAEILSIIQQQCNGYVFLISHRKSTLSIADTIYTL